MFEISGLLCEYETNPLGIDSPEPRLSWVINSDGRNTIQSAYQVIVSDSIESIEANKGNVWDSGKVSSSDNVGIVYRGPELKSGARYFWKARVWDASGQSTEFSKTSWWEMGLLWQRDWSAKWVEGKNLLRTEFDLESQPERARAYASSLSYYELRINGQKAGDRVLEPAPADPAKRIYYSTYDVTSLLRIGRNAIGLMLGSRRGGARIKR